MPAWIPDTTLATAYISRGDGQVLTYTRNGSAWQTDADLNGQLSSQFDALGKLTGWTYTTPEQDTEQYNAAGQLISITDRVGQMQTLTYSDGTDGVTSGNGGYILDANGAPTALILASGLLTRITDAYGRSISLGYDTQTRIVKMTAPRNEDYLYTYDSNNNLSSITYPDGKTKQYLYENATYLHALTGIMDENGDRYATYAYDDTGRATVTEHAGGAEKVSVAYNGDGSATVTDALGTARTQTFQKVQGIKRNGGTDQPGGSGCGASSSAQTYDANGNVSSRTDFKGNSTCYAYDLTRNLETVRLEGLPAGKACPADLVAYQPATVAGSVERKISTRWHPSYRLPTATAEPLRITHYLYNGDTTGATVTTCGKKADGITPVAGVLCKQTQQSSTDATGGAGFNAVVLGAVRATAYTYNSTGYPQSINGPRNDVSDTSSYTYYPADAACGGNSATGCRGQLASVVNALGHTTHLRDYDPHGRPGTLIDPNGLTTALTYDARGHLTTRATGSETTTYTYDGVGQLKTVTLPSGATYSYTYDAAHRLTDITDKPGNRIHYTLDGMGNRTKEETFNAVGNIAQTHSREFDALNRLWKDIGAVNQTTVYEYDANGNLTGITAPYTSASIKQTTLNTYDALDRLIKTTDPANKTTRYNYNRQGRLSQIIDPKNLGTQYAIDGLGNLTKQTSPDTGITSNTYDTAGNLRTRTDAKGQLASYSYDALNRVTGISYTGGTAPAQTINYSYDQGGNGIGHLTRIVDGTGTTAYSYDQHGRLIAETRQPATAPSTSYTTAYRYDVQGRLKGITYPSGRTVGYTFDGMGRISRITSGHNGATATIASHILYEPFGGVHSFTYGDGTTAPVQTYVRQRDGDGRIASYTLNGRAKLLGYDAASQLKFISDSDLANPVASYDYDALSRLSSYSQGTISHNYGYDADGNRTTQTIGSTISTYGYAPGSNRLASIQTGATTQSITHDPVGATTSDATRQYSYDLRGRLIQVTTAQGVINYEVNAQGLRTRKQAPYANTDTLYHYDSQGHLIGESPTGGTRFIREYIYLGDLPVAVLQ